MITNLNIVSYLKIQKDYEFKTISRKKKKDGSVMWIVQIKNKKDGGSLV